MSRGYREVYANFSERVIRVYQAFSPEIANPAIRAQTFKSPFKRARMTWIKPSFAWMMYRSGWGQKSGQETVLGIDITREGFEWALSRATLSHFEPGLQSNYEEWQGVLREAPVRVQWDPERTLTMQELPYRSIQIGLSGEAVDAYLDQWIARIEDISPRVAHIRSLVQEGRISETEGLVPVERPYPLPGAIAARLGANS